jgi:hypothetical protein
MGLLSFLFGTTIKQKHLLNAYAIVQDGFKNAAPELKPLLGEITKVFKEAQTVFDNVQRREKQHRIKPRTSVMQMQQAFYIVEKALTDAADQVKKENPKLSERLLEASATFPRKKSRFFSAVHDLS